MDHINSFECGLCHSKMISMNELHYHHVYSHTAQQLSLALINLQNYTDSTTRNFSQAYMASVLGECLAKNAKKQKKIKKKNQEPWNDNRNLVYDYPSLPDQKLDSENIELAHNSVSLPMVTNVPYNPVVVAPGSTESVQRSTSNHSVLISCPHSGPEKIKTIPNDANYTLPAHCTQQPSVVSQNQKCNRSSASLLKSCNYGNKSSKVVLEKNKYMEYPENLESKSKSIINLGNVNNTKIDMFQNEFVIISTITKQEGKMQNTEGIRPHLSYPKLHNLRYSLLPSAQSGVTNNCAIKDLDKPFVLKAGAGTMESLQQISQTDERAFPWRFSLCVPSSGTSNSNSIIGKIPEGGSRPKMLNCTSTTHADITNDKFIAISSGSETVSCDSVVECKESKGHKPSFAVQEDFQNAQQINILTENGAGIKHEDFLKSVDGLKWDLQNYERTSKWKKERPGEQQEKLQTKKQKENICVPQQLVKKISKKRKPAKNRVTNKCVTFAVNPCLGDGDLQIFKSEPLDLRVESTNNVYGCYGLGDGMEISSLENDIYGNSILPLDQEILPSQSNPWKIVPSEAEVEHVQQEMCYDLGVTNLENPAIDNTFQSVD